MHDVEDILKASAQILDRETPFLELSKLEAFVKSFLQRKGVFLDAYGEHGSPLYIIEKDVLLDRAKQFTEAFSRELPETCIFFALKSNNHPLIASTLVEAGLGLDVSSGLELQFAVDTRAQKILFSGPGKTEPELALAVENRDRVTVLMDSFGELERLERIAAEAGATLRVGVRLTTQETGLWRKFGVKLADLPQFFTEAQACNHVQLRGLQFHTSWNMTPANHVSFITALGAALEPLELAQRSLIEFVDIGGGFWPPQGEWLQPTGIPEGNMRKAVAYDAEPSLGHYAIPSAAISEFARHIGHAIRTHLFPHVACQVFTEPGRWLCNDAMHLLLQVVDKKADDLVITDAGTNAIGWERFETDYFPVINLSRPDLRERACHILGSLCTPRDLWGRSYFGEDIQPGDILLIPTQGAYTYSLRQHFIKPLPEVVIIASQTVPRSCTELR